MNEELKEIMFCGYYDVNGAKFLKTSIKGTFHRWADDPIYVDEKWIARTVGLVQDEGGKVYKAIPDKIQFLN